MNNNQTTKEILRAIGKLEGKVDGVNSRLDRMNGAVAKNVDDINTLQETQNKLSGWIKGIAAFGGVTAAVIGLLIAIFKK